MRKSSGRTKPQRSLSNYGVALWSTHRFHEAKIAFLSAIEQNNRYAVWANLGMVQMNLEELLRNRTAIVNVIPFNPIPELEFQTPARRDVQRFVDQLESGGLQVKVRFRKGDGISAACGQLRRTH